MIPQLCYSRLGRLAEVFDLLESSEADLPPDTMFIASPNVITVTKGWVEAECMVLDTTSGEARAWTQRVPLSRWLDLTVDLTQPNEDRSIVVD